MGMGMGMYHTVAGERGGIPHPLQEEKRGEKTRRDEGVNIKRNFFFWLSYLHGVSVSVAHDVQL